MTEDVRAIRAKFLEDRQKKIDAKNEVDPQERTSFASGLNQPPARRATDGKPPNTKEEHPLELAKRLEENENAVEDDDLSGVPDDKSTVSEIKAYLDAQGIDYNGITKKADLLDLIQAD